MNKLNNKNVGMGCTILGGIFFIAGIVLFIMYNSVNLYAQKTEATIVSKYNVDTTEEEESYTMLELAYKVGNEMVYTTYSKDEEIEEDFTSLEVYYNIKNPKEILGVSESLSFLPACIIWGSYHSVLNLQRNPVQKHPNSRKNIMTQEKGPRTRSFLYSV